MQEMLSTCTWLIVWLQVTYVAVQPQLIFSFYFIPTRVKAIYVAYPEFKRTDNMFDNEGAM